MRSRGLAILSVVVLALGLWIVLVERHAPTTDERLQTGDTILPDLDVDSIDQLEVVNEHGTFRIVRLEPGDGEEPTATTWQLAEPIVTEADASAVTSLLSALENLEAERRLQPGDVEPAAYGLETPTASVTLRHRDGTVSRLAVGDETPLGSQRAVTVDGSEIALVPAWFTSRLELDLTGWRSRRVARLSTADVVSVTIDRRGERVELVRDASRWRLQAPIADLADRDRVEGLIADLNGLEAQEFIDAPAGAEDLGLDPPRLHVTIHQRGRPSTTLEFATIDSAEAAEAEENSVLCRIDGDQIVRVDDRAEARLTSAVQSWRAAQLVTFESWNVDRVRMTRSANGTDGSAESIEIARVDGRWQSDRGAVDSTAVAQRLSDLASLRVLEYDAPSPEGDPMASLQLQSGDGSDIVLTVFTSPSDSERREVQCSLRPGTFAVSAEAIDALLDTSDLLLPDPPGDEDTVTESP